MSNETEQLLRDQEVEMSSLEEKGESSRLLGDDFEENQCLEVEDNIWEDIKAALYNTRFTAPLVALICVFIAYHITTSPYYGYEDSPLEDKLISDDVLRSVRPVLTATQQKLIHSTTKYAETTFWLPEPDTKAVKLRFFTFGPKEGNFQPPQLFYDGVLFGISAENSFGLEFTGQSNDDTASLYEQAKLLVPTPTSVLRRMVHSNTSAWSEEGVAVYYAYDDLKKQGKLSSDKLQPWKRVAEDIMKLARDFRQVYVTVWYPHEFGFHEETDQTGRREDPHRYKVILQHVLPTRTGLFGLGSKVPVWMSSVNFNSPVKPGPLDHVSRKEWTDDELAEHRRRRRLEMETANREEEVGPRNNDRHLEL